MLLTLLVLVPLLTGLLCWPLRERAVLERLNLLAFAVVAALALWLGAEVLARGTVEGAAELMRRDSATSPATLRRNVTSPGGTTAAALAALRAEGGLAALMTRAAAAAKRRAGELAG